jgi:ubiquinone/menaquinone biosynthesis C-methylase UbiE
VLKIKIQGEIKLNYIKSLKYTDIKKIYKECSGPGGLKLAEYMAEKMSIKEGKKLIDIGFYRGYQTCFLAKEYGVDIVAIDPGGVIDGNHYGIELLMENARDFGVDNKILGIKTGVPETLLPDNYFDYAYSTNCLEMLRFLIGIDGYPNALKEIYRILKKGGVLGIGEPMCRDIPIPNEIALYCQQYSFDVCFATNEVTKTAVTEAGFKVLEHGYCDQASDWWREYASCDSNREYANAVELMLVSHWLSFGYVIAIKE